MNPILRNIIAVILGIIAFMVVNMGLIMISPYLIPPPVGVDFITVEGLNANMHLMTPKYFILPFLAHALGTLAGALIVALIAVNHKMKFAIGLGVFALYGGIEAVRMIPAPLWYDILDLSLCYIPMAYIGGKLGEKYFFNKTNSQPITHNL